MVYLFYFSFPYEVFHLQKKKKTKKKNKKKKEKLSTVVHRLAVWLSSVCVILKYSVPGVYLKVRRGRGVYIQTAYHAKLMIVHQSLFLLRPQPGGMKL